MKLIIDIPEEDIEFIKSRGYHTQSLYDAIKNGITLDDVKAEIKEKSVWYNGQTYDGLCMALKILDNIGKAESEDKE